MIKQNFAATAALLLFLLPFNALAQTSDDSVSTPLIGHERSRFPFDSYLTQTRSKVLINSLISEKDSAIAACKIKKVKQPFNFNDQWKLAYYVHYGWEKDYKGNHEDINDIYKCNKPEKYFTGHEILAAFEITDSIFKGNPGYEEARRSINFYVQIPDSYRGFWTPVITSNGNLFIFENHLYPNGNAHSWLRQYFYYFVKKITIKTWMEGTGNS